MHGSCIFLFSSHCGPTRYPGHFASSVETEMRGRSVTCQCPLLVGGKPGSVGPAGLTGVAKAVASVLTGGVRGEAVSHRPGGGGQARVLGV